MSFDIDQEKIDKYLTLIVEQTINESEPPYGSLTIKPSLNPKFWRNGKLDKVIRKRLLKIAKTFEESLESDLKLTDVLFLGSLTSYNWDKKYSDIDLHLVFSDEGLDETEKEFYSRYFDAKRRVLGDKHDISIYGYDVEGYFQFNDETQVSNGIYSVLNDEWLKKPSKQNPKLDKEEILKKYRQLESKIDSLIDDGDVQGLDKIKDQIKTIRKKSLATKEGEFSVGNLVFKLMRRSGLIEKLMSSTVKLKDKELSLP